jgi:hypothetical protein
MPRKAGVVEKLFSPYMQRRLHKEKVLTIGKHEYTRTNIVNELGISVSPAVYRVDRILKKLDITTPEKLYNTLPESLAAITGFGESCMYVVMALVEAHGFDIFRWWGYESGNEVRFNSFKYKIKKEAAQRQHPV